MKRGAVAFKVRARTIAAVAAGVLAGTDVHGQDFDTAASTTPLPGTRAVPIRRAPVTGVDAVGFGLPDLPDRRGRRSDTFHFLAYQVAAISILYSLPESTTGWTAESKENYSFDRWWDNARKPHLDTDDFFWNYVTHPYWGAAYFVRSRERGYGDLQSFWYAASLSAIYEFGAEALFEEPSIQDLIVTPVGGWLVGSYFMHVREGILERHENAGPLPFRLRFVMTMTDPLGAINRTVDRWFGFGEQFNLQPLVYERPLASAVNDDAPAETERVYAIVFSFAW